MNSQQRRKNRRYFDATYIYKVRLSCPVGLRYFEWDRKVEEMDIWCKKQFQKKWTYTQDWDHSIFYFSENRDATYFALKWS